MPSARCQTIIIAASGCLGTALSLSLSPQSRAACKMSGERACMPGRTLADTAKAIAAWLRQGAARRSDVDAAASSRRRPSPATTALAPACRGQLQLTDLHDKVLVHVFGFLPLEER